MYVVLQFKNLFAYWLSKTLMVGYIKAHNALKETFL
jgi:hypothetical protein